MNFILLFVLNTEWRQAGLLEAHPALEFTGYANVAIDIF
jgi:hypothetical protein